MLQGFPGHEGSPWSLDLLPTGQLWNHWSSSASTGERVGAECTHAEEKKRGTMGFTLSESWVKKGRAYTGKKGCSHRSKLLGAVVFGRYALFMLRREEGSCSGIMVLDKRQLSDRDLAGKKNSHKWIYSGKSLPMKNWSIGRHRVKHPEAPTWLGSLHFGNRSIWVGDWNSCLRLMVCRNFT